METLVCCIARNENNYIREWVEHYLNLGVSKVVIWDNGRGSEESPRDLLKDLTEDGTVNVLDARDAENCQKEAYQQCYNFYSKAYNWLMFFDVDEFLELEHFDKINDFLGQKCFDKVNLIRVGWKHFTDSGLVKVENSNYSRTRFTETVPEDKGVNDGAKSIIRGGIGFKFYMGPAGEHGIRSTCDHDGIVANALGEECENHNWDGLGKFWKGAWLCHYPNKTVEEYCTVKLKRLWPTHILPRTNPYQDFFNHNKWTVEKDKLFKYYINGN